MKIEQLIEKEAKRYADSMFVFNVPNMTEYCQKVRNDSFIDGAHFALSQFKWRKAEEVLPEAVIEEYSSPVLIKTKYGVYDVAKYNWTYKDFIANSISILGVTHWMPIPEVK